MKTVKKNTVKKTATKKKSKAKKKPSELLAHGYSIEPRNLNKMLKIFKRCGLEFHQTEWMDGEMNGYVKGERENVLAFVMDARKVSRRSALSLVADPVKLGRRRRRRSTLQDQIPDAWT